MDEKKKIGILTFHNAHNYGAVLQAYALKTKLNRMGYKAKILNYQNPYIARLYRKGIHIDFWKRDILPSRWGKVFHEVGENLYGLREWENQWTAFEKFIGEKLLDGQEKKLTLDDLAKEQCDVYILGSDQIWARELTHGFDPAYFGQFAPGCKKISYAASVPNGSIPEAEQAYFEQALKSLAHISVREEKLARVVEKLTGKEVTTVVDPTLLLERADYEDLLYEEPLVKEKYIFAYFVVEDELLGKCAEKAAAVLGYRLIELHYKKTPKLKSENMIFDETFQSGMEAVVVEKSFAGGLLRVVLKLADGTEVIANRHGIDAGVQPGQKVTCHFDAENAVLVDLPSETESGAAV